MRSGRRPGVGRSNTKVDLFDEAGAAVGFVNYSQARSGDLRLVLAIKRADPGSSYRLSIECSAQDNHTSSCEGAIELGVVAANGQGNGNSGALHVSAEALRDAFGAGRTAVHVELGKQPGGGCLTGSGIILLAPGGFPAPEGAQG